MMNKKGVILFWIVTLFVFVLIILTATIIVPLGKQYGEDTFTAGAEIILDAKEVISDINNETEKTEIISYLDDAYNSRDNSIELSNQFYEYGWLIILILTALGVFITAKAFYSRQQ